MQTTPRRRWTRDAVWACLVIAAAFAGYGMARFGAPRVPRVTPIVAAGSPRSNVVGDVRGQLVGRIAVDANGNGEWDSGEEFVAEPGRACPHTQLVSGIVVRWEGADQFGSTAAMNCNPEPFYHARLARGRYRVTLEVPPSWRITSVAMADVDIEPGRDTHLWFSVRKRDSAPTAPEVER